MTQLEMFDKFVEKLVKSLPMNDVNFITTLSANQLLPGDIKNKIELLTQSEKASYFLHHVIKPALDIDDFSSFKDLLSIMQNCGYGHVKRLSDKIEQYMNKHLKPDVLKSKTYEERFNDIDVEASFHYLLSKLEALWSDADFTKLKKVCKRDTLLSDKLRNDVKNVHNLDETLDLLSTSPFCSWMELRILKRMATVAENPEATHMINVFEKCVHNRKCSEVKLYFRKNYINPDHYTLVEAKLNQRANDLMVCDLINYCHKLESICNIPAGSSVPVGKKEGCLKVCFAIPTYCCLHAYETAKNAFFRLRPIHIQYLQIGTFQKIYAIGSTKAISDESFLSWILSIDNFSDHNEVISHYYPYLLQHMDADSVSHMMYCEHFITDDDYQAITAAPNDRMMNDAILQYIRVMDLPTLLKFIDLLKAIETQNSLASYLKFSLKLISPVSSEKWTLSGANLKKLEMNKYCNNLKLQLMFLDVIDKLTLQMSINDVVMLANGFDKIMASDQLALFNVCLKEKLNYSPFPFILKIYLSPFMTWFDHSILKELVIYSNNKEAIKQLKIFDSYVNKDEPIKSCIPEVSHLMIPCKGNESDYTLLVTKHFSKDHNEMALRDLLSIKNELTLQWGITDHALQLVAMHSELSYFYWMFSKEILPLIEKGIDQGQLALWSKGIIATILPNNFFPHKDIQATIKYDFQLSDFSTTERDTQNKALVKQNEAMKSELTKLQMSNTQLTKEINDYRSRLDINKIKIGELEKQLKFVITKYPETKQKQALHKSAVTHSDSESLPAPTNVKATVSTPNSIEVTWDQSSGATGYLISCTTTATYAGGKNVVVGDGDTTSHALTNLVENTLYVVTVHGLTRDGKKSLCSDKVAVRTFTAVPSSPPQDITVSSNDPASLIVTWKSPSKTDCNGSITGYVIQCTRVGIFESDDKVITNVNNTTTLTISGLIACAKYKVTVAAVNAKGTGPFSKAVTATSGEDAPSEPCSLKIVTVTSTSITLQWMPPKYINGVITHYSVEHDGVIFDEFGGNESEEMTGTIEGLSHNTPYVLEMKAHTKVGPGPPVSLAVRTLLPAPTNVKAKVAIKPNIVKVTWDQSPDATGYFISCISTVSYAGNKRVMVNGGGTTCHTLTDLVENTPYDITVQGIAEDGRKSDLSTEVPITTQKDAPSSPPEDIKVTSDDPAMLMVSWKQPLKENCNGPITGYVMHYARVGKHTDNMIVNVPSDTKCAISGLYANEEYSVTVAAVNHNGTGPFSRHVVATSGEDTPSEPHQLEIASVASTYVTLRWLPPKYPNGVIEKYSIHYAGVDINDFGNVSDNMIGTIEGLLPDTKYVFEMKAHTRVGPGTPVSLAVKTRLCAPTNVNAKMLRSNSVEVTWDKSSDVTGYLISCNSSVSYAGNKNVVVHGGDTTTHILTNLVENTPYDITVQGITRDGRQSDLSTEVSITTQKAAPNSAPKDIEVLSANPASLKISRRPPSEIYDNGPITGYVIQYARVGSDDKMIMNVANDTDVTISGLFASVQYSVTMAAVNNHGTGPFSEPVIATSGEDIPSEPQQLEILLITSTSVTLQWMPPKYPNGDITRYSVQFDGRSIDEFGDKESDKITGTIEELLPNTEYVIKMKAHTQVGPGPPLSLSVETSTASLSTFEKEKSGYEQLSLRLLNRHVRGSVGMKWHDLGIELLDYNDVRELDRIEAEHPTDHNKCCTKMFDLWLSKQPTASWNQLIEALTQPGMELDTLATNIEQKFLHPKPQATVPASHSEVTVMQLDDNQPRQSDESSQVEHTIAQSIFCSEARKRLDQNHKELSYLSYEKMSKILLAKQVITDQETLEIAEAEVIGISRMEQVLDSLIRNLECNDTTKYKAFIEALEESGDLTLQNQAKKLYIKEED